MTLPEALSARVVALPSGPSTGLRQRWWSHLADLVTADVGGLAGVSHRPTLQAPGLANYPIVSVRFRGDLAAVAAAVRRTVEAGGNEYVGRLELLRDVLARAPSSERMTATVAGLAGVLAALLGGIGLHGLLTYQVARREREFGVRLAVGATPRRVLWVVLADGAQIAALGLAIGTPLAWLAARLLSSLTFGVTPSDPITFAAVGVFIAALVVVVGAYPARRASSVDPAVSWRAE